MAVSWKQHRGVFDAEKGKMHAEVEAP